MADWEKIKAEYITTEVSVRDLAQKYGVHYTTIGKKASKEGWQELRQQQTNTTLTKILTAVSDRKVDRAARLMTVADKLLTKIEQAVDQEGLISAGAIKNLSDALKNIRDTQMIRSDADMREQEARIRNLEKQAEKEATDNEIKVTIEGDLEVYSK